MHQLGYGNNRQADLDVTMSGTYLLEDLRDAVATPVPRRGYRIGVPKPGKWREVLNSNASLYGGTDEGNYGRGTSEPIPNHGFEQSLLINLPPLGMVIFKQ